MNLRMIGFVLGRILLTEAGLLVLPLVTALLYGESLLPWLVTMGLLVLWGLAFLFAWFTFRPPVLGLFLDPVTMTYGLPQ